MMIRTLLSLGLLALLSAPPRSAAEEKMTAEAVLKKAIDAAGGTDALKKYPAMRQKIKGSMEIDGMDFDITGELSYMEPDKLKITLNTAVQGQKVKIVQLINGDAVVTTVAGMKQPLEEDDKQDMKEMLTEIKVETLYPLLDAGAYGVKLLPEKAAVDGADAYVLAVKPKDSKEIKLFVDAKTFLVTKTEKVGKDPKTKKERREEDFPSDYKKVQGVMFAMKSKTLHDGKPAVDVRITEVKLLDKIPASEFDVSD